MTRKALCRYYNGLTLTSKSQCCTANGTGMKVATLYISECPRGTFRDSTSPSNKECQRCPENMTTETTRSRSQTECVCKDGYSVYPRLGKNCRGE